MENQLPPNASTGAPYGRVDGRLKVTGQARYAAEHPVPGCAHGVLVTSAVARGRIRQLDAAAAEKAPGVLAIVSHLNAPPVPGYQSAKANHNPRVEGQEFRVFFDDQIRFSNQPVALAVAETLEQAQYAASLVRVEYEVAAHHTELARHLAANLVPQKEPDYVRGQPDAYQTAPVRVEQEYRTPMHVHNPLEMHAVIALWEGETLTVYTKTQGPKLAQQDLMRMFQLPEGSVRVHSPFVGGAFGGASRIWPPETAAILGARKVGRPVKLLNRRDHEFNLVGYRPQSIQRLGLGATADGTLVGITHQAYGTTSRHEQFAERIVHPTKSAYAVPNLNTRYRLVPLDVSTPCWTRGPGETSGAFALECAMDELAVVLNMDPLALRLKNYADRDPENGKPWSSKHLDKCYERGAARFGWSQRPPAPRAMPTADGYLLGWGMSTGIYKAERSAATARARLLPDGTLLVQSATADTGPGTATVMTQIAADASGIPPANIRFELGESALPEAPVQAGSHTAASVGSAVHETCVALQQQLLALARRLPGQPPGPAGAGELTVAEGFVVAKQKSGRRLRVGEVLKQHQLPALEVTRQAQEAPEMKAYSGKSFCANFVEVRVHALTGEVRVTRVVSVVDAGRVLNANTARSQVLGAVVWGIGMALMEDARLDHRHGRVVNHDLAEYHVPVNADVPAIEVEFINEPDFLLDPIGAKGLGEIGLVGFAAAVANAVYHATGRRVRELPITPDKVAGQVS